jgi:GT2 family glycosyltransferase
MTPPDFFIVVLSYNGLEDTRKCLTSLAPAMRPGATALLVDNGSTDGTFDAVGAEFPWCGRLRVEVNRGPAAGNNAGIKAALDAGAEWILLLNNDTTVDTALLDRLREAVAAHPRFDVLGPVILFMDDPTEVMSDGTQFNPAIPRGFFLRIAVPLGQSHPPQITPVDVVNGACMAIKADTIRRIGMFDEAFFIYHDESDLCLRAIEAGGQPGILDHALVWHKGSATFRVAGKKSARYYDIRNLLYLIRKHRWAPRHGRSRSVTMWVYLKYAYYWYCFEREQGFDDSAAGVIEGLYDGLLGRQGRYEPKRSRWVGPLRLAFELVRRRPRLQRAGLQT